MTTTPPSPAPRVGPYGTWQSPVDAAAVAAGGLRLSSVSMDGDDVYWIEGRPAEGGRNVLVRMAADGRREDVTPAGTNVRTRVHEYGGGAYVVRAGVVYYSELRDQRLYRLSSGPPEPITPDAPWRFADGDVHPTRPWLACVREDHASPAGEPVSSIVVVRTGGGGLVDVLAAGHDFYAYPRFSPDGTRLLWMAWRHPRMPWDGTELWVADLVETAGAIRLTNAQLIAGGDTESIFQPGWAPDGTIYFVSDRNGWWNLYRTRATATSFETPGQPVCAIEADCGAPLWQFGASTWAAVTADTLLLRYVEQSRWHLASVDVESGDIDVLELPVSPAQGVCATRRAAAFIGQSPLEADVVVRLDLETGELEDLTDVVPALEPRYVSTPEPITFATRDGGSAHALFYPPKNPEWQAPAGERPPVLVVSHGGPTAAARPGFDLALQFWTTRGFAVVDVDYRGSTGYGRAYREALRERWGELDVTDCLDAAWFLVSEGRVDANRLIIRGASAGGFTTLAALTFHSGAFKAGASYYGVSDLEALARDTHKFEARYLDSLVGPYPAMRDRYRARSPIHAVERLSAPIILFQGLDDPAVPPDQARLMAEAVERQGLPVALLLFEGEQHGFRKVDTIRTCLEAELGFYGVVLGFNPAGNLSRVPIANAPVANGAPGEAGRPGPRRAR